MATPDTSPFSTPPEPARVTKVLTVKCPNCGAQTTFNPSKQKLHCENCGHEEAIATAQDKIVEVPIEDALHLSDAQKGMDVPMRAFHCNTCGAVTAVSADTVNLTCSFCTGTNVNEEAFENRVIKPFGILPFKVNKKDADARFKEWIGRGWFLPSDLQKLAALDKMDGVYIPFWTYDAQTDSEWTAESGYYYYETETYTDDQGNSQTRQVQHVRWTPSWGSYDHWFDDVTVVASGGLKQQMIERVYPFNLASSVNYEPRFMLGWKSEVYAADVKEGFTTAESIMDNYIEREVTKQIPGDTYRFLNITTQKSRITFKHMLLPVWVAAYKYNDKTYQVVVNGETGKIAGDKPISWIKVALLVLAIAVVAAVVYFLVKK